MWKVTRVLNRAYNAFDYHVLAPAVATFDVIYFAVLDEIEHRCIEKLTKVSPPMAS
jgi:hypothetical protein